MPAPTAASEITRLEAELAEVRAAISRVYDKQSYSTGEAGLAAERARLDLLTAREAQLEGKLAKLYRGQPGIRVWRGVPTR